MGGFGSVYLETPLLYSHNTISKLRWNHPILIMLALNVRLIKSEMSLKRIEVQYGVRLLRYPLERCFELLQANNEVTSGVLDFHSPL